MFVISVSATYLGCGSCPVFGFGLFARVLPMALLVFLDVRDLFDSVDVLNIIAVLDFVNLPDFG